MSKWDDEFAAHALWSTVEQFRATLDRCPRTDDVGQRDHVNRLRRLLVELDAHRNVDPMLASKQVLDNLYSGINNINGQVGNYINQPVNWGSYLVPAATTHTDQALAYLMQLPSPPRGAARSAAAAAATAYRETADDAIENIRDGMEKAIAAIEEDRDSSAAATREAMDEVSRLRVAVAETEARIVDEVTRLDTAITTHQSAFETQQNDRADRFQKELGNLRQQTEEQLDSFRQVFQRQAVEETQVARDHLEQLHRLHEEAKAVVEATGRRVVTTEFGQYAAKQDRAAFGWSITAVVLALCGFGFIAFQIATLEGSDVSWGLVAYKITASLALLLVAAFAGKQSAGHREQEKQAKRRQLEINALEPFLSRLPDPQAEALRAKMADRILVQPGPDPAETRTAGSPSLNDLGTAIGVALREYTGKKDA